MPNAHDAARSRELIIDHDRLIAVVGIASHEQRRWVDALRDGLDPDVVVRSYNPAALDAALRNGDEVGAIVVIDAPIEAAELASRHGIPMLWVRDGSPEAVAAALPEARVTAETLMCIRAANRPVRSVLAECIVEPLAGGSLRVEGDHGLDAVVPMLRAVNRDPFTLLPEVRCAHRASSMIGLCWTGAEPLADRMIHRRNRVVVTALDGEGVDVTCAAGRFRLHTTRVTIGPARRLRVVHLAPLG
jgi:hypothetical protein